MTRELHNHHFDSTIWNDLQFRDDDIVISTYAKSGTTWVQQIVAQLLRSQKELAGQVLKQAPQWFGSFWVLTQRSPQSWSGGSQNPALVPPASGVEATGPSSPLQAVTRVRARRAIPARCPTSVTHHLMPAVR